MATCNVPVISQSGEQSTLILSNSESSESPVPHIDFRTIIGNYMIEKRIGQGTYGEVRLATNRITNQKVAIKTIEKQSIRTERQRKRLQREVRILRLLHHPHIVKVFDVIETSLAIYIVMEYVDGGELFDYLVANKRLKEHEARHFFRQTISAVEYCHSHFIVHRDLKPENLLIDENKNIKIIDFGFTNIYRKDTLLDTFCGSPYYAAPEMILAKKYTGPEVDVWSLGVILYAMLCGSLPFDDTNVKLLHKKIISGYYFRPKYLSKEAKHLISRMIVVDPLQRATLSEIKIHPWLNEGYDTVICPYISPRSVIDTSCLDERALNRLLPLFSFNMDEIYAGLGSADSNGIQCAYYLIVESFARADEVTQLAAHIAHSIPLRVDNKDSRLTATLKTTTSKDHHHSQQESTMVVVPDEESPSVHNEIFEDHQKQRRPLSTRSSFLLLLSKLSGRQSSTASKSKLGHKEGLNSNSLSFPLHSSFNYERDLSMPTCARVTTNSANSISSTNYSPNISEMKSDYSSLPMRFRSNLFHHLDVPSKDPSSLILELIRVLQLHQIRFIQLSSYLLLCEMDRQKGILIFEAEIRQASRLLHYRIHFKRIRGCLWGYKRLCSKLLKDIRV
jgi:5'-AMP-activated protein kinase catalytic alpha subunit